MFRPFRLLLVQLVECVASVHCIPISVLWVLRSFADLSRTWCDSLLHVINRGHINSSHMACPVMAAAAAAPALEATDITKCPMHAIHGQPQQEEPAAVCPLGFGSSRGPKLSTLHCPVCKGLLFDAHTVNCKHTFCHACISKMKHYGCPVCGEDVSSMEPNTEVAGLVDTFLDTHSKSPQLVAAQADLGPLPDNSPASFFLAQGLKSLAGGNVHAAIHRLGRCREALLAATAAGQPLQQPGTEEGPSSQPQSGCPHLQHHEQDGEIDAAAAAGGSAADAAAAACQMAAVCGSLGDCYQRLGDTAQAEQLYLESISSVQQYAECDAEAAHAMSVSLNKLGDMRYIQQQLQDAKQLYKQALELRQLYCGPLTKGEAGPEQQLELASSLVKVADVCRAMQETDEADRLWHSAQGVCMEVQHMVGDLPGHVSRRLQMLLDVLHVQSAETAGGAAESAAAGQQ